MNCYCGCSRRFVGAGNVSRSNPHNAAVTSCNFNKSPKKAAIINKKNNSKNFLVCFKVPGCFMNSTVGGPLQVICLKRTCL